MATQPQSMAERVDYVYLSYFKIILSLGLQEFYIYGSILSLLHCSGASFEMFYTVDFYVYGIFNIYKI